MRALVKEFLGLCARALPFAEPVYEFGSLQVPGQEGFADMRPFFPGKQYVGFDYREGPGVDRVMDMHEIDLPSDSAGSVLCLDTLEHVEFPHKAVDGMYRILKPGGILVISSVMKYPIHSYPHDYWRFTPKAFESLLARFGPSLVEFAGDPNFPHTVVGVGAKGTASPEAFGNLRIGLGRWKTRWPDVSPKRSLLRRIVKRILRS